MAKSFRPTSSKPAEGPVKRAGAADRGARAPYAKPTESLGDTSARGTYAKPTEGLGKCAGAADRSVRVTPAKPAEGPVKCADCGNEFDPARVASGNSACCESCGARRLESVSRVTKNSFAPWGFLEGKPWFRRRVVWF